VRGLLILVSPCGSYVGDKGMWGALFSGRVVRVGRIRSNNEYNRPETFVMSVEDEDGRKLRVGIYSILSYVIS
jgi:hypothetical protein